MPRPVIPFDVSFLSCDTRSRLRRARRAAARRHARPGSHRSARAPLLLFRRPDGSFRLEQRPDALYWEFFGYNLWGWGRHHQLTRDRAFLEKVYPGVVKAMEWFEGVTSKDPLGVLPPATIADDAFLKDCRQTGQHIWGLIGLRNAVAMAKAMGRAQDVTRFEDQQRRFRAAFDRLLDAQVARTGGSIPPALERTTAGNDWDNLRTLHPEPLFDPNDRRVERSSFRPADAPIDLPRQHGPRRRIAQSERP